MLIFNMFIPVVMIVCGFFMYKFPPKTINGLIGYRTRRSGINKDTWMFANRYSGKLWLILGVITLIAAFIVTVVFANSNGETAERVNIIVEIIELIILLGSIIPVEIALKRTFDNNGIRRKND